MVGLRVGTAAVDHSTYSAMQVGKQNAMIGFLGIHPTPGMPGIGYARCVDGVDALPISPLRSSASLQF